MSRDDLLTREEVLAERPARRAQTLRYLIQNYAAYAAARSRLDAELVPLEEAAREQDRLFLEAFAVGRTPRQRPSLQTLELQTPDWRSLVPERPSLRAALAHLLTPAWTSSSPAVRSSCHSPSPRAGSASGCLAEVIWRSKSQTLPQQSTPTAIDRAPEAML